MPWAGAMGAVGAPAGLAPAMGCAAWGRPSVQPGPWVWERRCCPGSGQLYFHTGTCSRGELGPQGSPCAGSAGRSWAVGELPALPGPGGLGVPGAGHSVAAPYSHAASRTLSGVEAIKSPFHPALPSVWCAGAHPVPHRGPTALPTAASHRVPQPLPAPRGQPGHRAHALGQRHHPSPRHGATLASWGPEPSRWCRCTEPVRGLVREREQGGPTPGQSSALR